MSLTFAGLFVFAYLLGSIPFAVIFGRMKGVDILKEGSGNPGMTNVIRSLGPGWGIACFVLDVLKSLVPTVVARFLLTGPLWGLDAEMLWFLIGCGAILGHCASVFLRFKGGKGISTALGAIIGTSPVCAGLCFGLFVIFLLVTRYMSVASVIGVTSVIVFNLLVPHESHQLLVIYVILSAFVVLRHVKNFKRLREGTEPKFKFKKTRRDPVSENNEESLPDRGVGPNTAEPGPV